MLQYQCNTIKYNTKGMVRYIISLYLKLKEKKLCRVTLDLDVCFGGLLTNMFVTFPTHYQNSKQKPRYTPGRVQFILR
jgi:hypothetical protein